MKGFIRLAFSLSAVYSSLWSLNLEAALVVSNVEVVKLEGEDAVDISYDLYQNDGLLNTIQIDFSNDGLTWTELQNLQGDVGSHIEPGLAKKVRWTHGGEVANDIFGEARFRVRATNEFSLIPAGTFIMGSPLSEPGRDESENQHEVTLTRSFYVSQTEITNGEYMRVMQWALDQGLVSAGLYSIDYEGIVIANIDWRDREISVVDGELIIGENLKNKPVVNISQFGAMVYCHFRSIMEGRESAYDIEDKSVDFSKSGYRLLTEAEWEYACRAGTTTSLYSGELSELGGSPIDPLLNSVGWYSGNSPSERADVSLKDANAWGLYDMHGNVYEWCWDSFSFSPDSYPSDSMIDPVAEEDGGLRPIRGGAWSFDGRYSRSASREFFHGETFRDYVGFRVALSPNTGPVPSIPVYIRATDLDGDGFASVSIDGSESFGGNAPVVSMKWDWGDLSSSDPSIEASFPEGVTPVYLTVTDSDGHTSVGRTQVEVLSPAELALELGRNLAKDDKDFDGSETVVLGSELLNSDVSLTSWSWSWPGEEKEGGIVTGEFPSGATNVHLELEDRNGFKRVFDLEVNVAAYSNIPSGLFSMGSPDGELGKSQSELQHDVLISKSFVAAQTEVTVCQLADVFQWALGRNMLQIFENDVAYNNTTLLQVNTEGSHLLFDDGEFLVEEGFNSYPAVGISWFGAIAYCHFLSLKEGVESCYDIDTWSCDFSKGGYRLPTEAEWEYACRADSVTAFYSGGITNTACDESNLTTVGWYCGNASGSVHPVSMLQSNGWGLFDTHGNVWEWCWDSFADYGSGLQVDPVPNTTLNSKVVRGGAWDSFASFCRSGFRLSEHANSLSLKTGFRVVCSTLETPEVDAGESITVTDVDSDGFATVAVSGIDLGVEGSIEEWDWFWSTGFTSGKNANLLLPVGVNKVVLRATDAVGKSGSDLVLINVVSASGLVRDQEIFDLDSDGFESVAFDATGYNDDLSIASWEWTWDAGSASGETTTGSLPIGVTEVTLQITGTDNSSSVALFSVHVKAALGANFIDIPTGTFLMGSTTSEKGRGTNETQHVVTLTRKFRMMPLEITNQQVADLLKWAYDEGYIDIRDTIIADKASGFTILDSDRYQTRISFSNGEFEIMSGYANHPVVHITWKGAVFVAHYSSVREGIESCYDSETYSCDFTKPGYRLPTEAEWEHACRAGTTTAFYTGDIVHTANSPVDPSYDLAGWYGGNAHDTHIGGLKVPNSWGLYDMHGNVFEWCWDRSGNYPSSSVTDPEGPSSGSDRIYRGGSHGYDAFMGRSAMRLNNRESSILHRPSGFRLCTTILD